MANLPDFVRHRERVQFDKLVDYYPPTGETRMAGSNTVNIYRSQKKELWARKETDLSIQASLRGGFVEVEESEVSRDQSQGQTVKASAEFLVRYDPEIKIYGAVIERIQGDPNIAYWWVKDVRILGRNRYLLLSCETFLVRPDIVSIVFDGVVGNQAWRAGDAIDPLVLPRAEGGNPPLVYSIAGLPTGLEFNAMTLVITGTPAVEQTVQVSYRATDADGDISELTFDVLITAPNSLTFGGQIIQDEFWAVGTQILPIVLPLAITPNGPIVYSIVSGLPPGVVFNAVTRTLSGTPTAQRAAALVTYRAVDRAGAIALLTFNATVQADFPVAFGSETIADQTWIVRFSIGEITLPEALTGNAPITYEIVEPLPAGVEFDPETRVLSGEPTGITVPTNYTYRGTDSGGDTADLTFAVTVGNPPAMDVLVSFGNQTIPDQQWRAGSRIIPFALPTVTQGNTPLEYSVEGLPGGIIFNPVTRIISGELPLVAAGGDSRFTYQALDGDGDIANLTGNYTVEAFPNTVVRFVDSQDDLVLRVNSDFGKGQIITQLGGVLNPNNPIQTIDGPVTGSNIGPIAWLVPKAQSVNAPVTYSLAGDLPAGVTFGAVHSIYDADGEVTPGLFGRSAVATHSRALTLRATDANGNFGEITFTIRFVVDVPVTFGVEGTDYLPAQRFYRKGTPVALSIPQVLTGNPPVSFTDSLTCITSRAGYQLGLPLINLAFDHSTRQFSGVADRLGMYELFVSVRDADGSLEELFYPEDLVVVGQPSGPVLAVNGLVDFRIGGGGHQSYRNVVTEIVDGVAHWEDWSNYDYDASDLPGGSLQLAMPIDRAKITIPAFWDDNRVTFFFPVEFDGTTNQGHRARNLTTQQYVGNHPLRMGTQIRIFRRDYERDANGAVTYSVLSEISNLRSVGVDFTYNGTRYTKAVIFDRAFYLDSRGNYEAGREYIFRSQFYFSLPTSPGLSEGREYGSSMGGNWLGFNVPILDRVILDAQTWIVGQAVNLQLNEVRPAPEINRSPELDNPIVYSVEGLPAGGGV